MSSLHALAGYNVQQSDLDLGVLTDSDFRDARMTNTRMTVPAEWLYICPCR
jgi:hypothetical protein